MVGRTDLNGETSLRALRSDLMNALRTCDAAKPAAYRMPSRSVASRIVPDPQMRLDPPEPLPIRAMPERRKQADPMAAGRAAKIQASFQAELSPEIDQAVGFVGRCFALPEIAALLSVCGRALGQTGVLLLEEPQTSRRRISASKLKAKQTFKFRLAEA